MNLRRRVGLFYLVTICFSWPIIIVVDGRLIPAYHSTGFVMLIALFGHMAAMMGPMPASIVILRYFENKSLLRWKGAKRKYYLYALCAGVLIYVLPGMLDLLFGRAARLRSTFDNYDAIFLISYLSLGWFAGVGEEYGWSGFLLTELGEKIGKSRAIAVSGCLRGIWHLPVLVIPVYLQLLNGEKTLPGLLFLCGVFVVQLVVSNIFFSALFGLVWFKTGSIALVGWLHLMLDFFRDLMIFLVIGFSASIWFKLGYVVLFIPLAAWAFTRIAREDGYSNFLQIFYKKSYSR